MKYLALISVLLPILGGLMLAITWPLKERVVSITSRVLVLLTLCFISGLVTLWVATGFQSIEFNFGTLYRLHDYSFPMVLALDGASCIYLLITAILASVTVKYSRFYLHREQGYRRYFALILFMIGGSNLLALSGTLDLLFAAWEIIGISSFLLISFYWRRDQPARNSFVTFIVYRICDVGLLAGAMLTHVLWIDGDRFLAMMGNEQAILVHAQALHPIVLPAIAALLILASLGKSAQFPFINWLVRALEGPTPSSAIFYGALSIHAGAFLLIRTEPIWGHYTVLRLTIIMLGVLSAVLATVVGRTLSNIKGQITYAAIAQVGIIFIEVALGWHLLALCHLALHSLLRAYQILISPSVVAHALRVMGSNIPIQVSISNRILNLHARLTSPFEVMFYRLSLTDFYLWPSNSANLFPSFRLNRSVQNSAKEIGKWFIRTSVVASLLCSFALASNIIDTTKPILAYIFAGSAVLLGLIIQTSKQKAGDAWLKIGLCIFFEYLVVSLLAPQESKQLIFPFFALLALGWSLGWFLLRRNYHLSLSRFHGLSSKSPGSAVMCLISLVTIAGIPPSVSFFAEDLFLHWVFERNSFLAAIFVLAITLVSIATARVFVRLSFGGNHE